MSAVSIASAPARTGKFRFGALWLAAPGLLFLAVPFVSALGQVTGA